MPDNYDIDFSLHVGDRVSHRSDQSLVGTVRKVEDNQLSVMVEWDVEGEEGSSLAPEEDWDFQWSNKLIVI